MMIVTDRLPSTDRARVVFVCSGAFKQADSLRCNISRDERTSHSTSTGDGSRAGSIMSALAQACQ